MYRVVNTISYRDAWTRRHPASRFAHWGEGVMALLDPAQIAEVPPAAGREVTLVRPDGSEARLVAKGGEANHGVVGLFFEGADEADIPVGSSLIW